MELRTDRYKLKDIFPEQARKYAQRLHIKADEIPFIRKGIPMDPESIRVDDGERAAIRLITTPDLDRDNEILIPDGAILDDFRASPVVLYGHDYHDKLPVGKDEWVKVTKKGILAKTVYAMHQFAEDLFQCVKGGFLNCSSVGFIPVEVITSSQTKEFSGWQDKLERDYGIPKEVSGKARAIYSKWILLEHSDVPVPSNAHALNLAVAKGLIKSDALKKDLGLGPDPAPVTDGLGPDDKPTFATVTLGLDIKADDVPVSEPTPEVMERVSGSDPVPVAKMLDLDKNPSTNDIWDALNRALNPPSMEEKPGSINTYRPVWDLYPVDYPNGHCVYNENQADGTNLGYMVDYTYDKGVVTLGENPIPVAAGYVRRGRKDIGNLSVKIDVDTSEAAAKVNALKAKVDAMAETYKAIEAKATPAPLTAVPASPPPPIDVLDIEPDEDVIIIEPDADVLTIEPRAPKPAPAPAPKALTPSEIEGAIVTAIDAMDIKGVIDKSVRLTLDRLRGRVR